MNSDNMIQPAAPNSSSIVARAVTPAIGLAVMVIVGPVVNSVVHATAVVVLELGHISSLAVKIFCN